MTTTVSASDEPAKVLISDNGAPGDDGDPGQNGTGLNSIRKSLIDNPLIHIFKTNKLVEVSAPTGTDSDVAWTRASAATYIDRYGVVKSAAINEPREEKHGFLIEGTSTNDIIWSEDFTNAAWNKFSSTVTPNFSTSPDGQNNATRWLDSGTSNHFLAETLNVNNGQLYSLSMWVKSNGAGKDIFKLLISGGQSSGEFTATNEWVRYEFSVIVDEAVKQVGITRSDANQQNDLLIWGAQLEEYNAASSYIPTTASSVTRSNDNAASASYNNISELSGSWSFTCEFSTTLASMQADNSTVVSFGDSLGQQRIIIKNNGSLLLRDSTSAKELLPAGTITENQSSFMAVTYDGANAIGYIDSVSGSQVVAIMTNVTGNSKWGDRPSLPEQINGNIKSAKFYDFTLNADEVSFLS